MVKEEALNTALVKDDLCETGKSDWNIRHPVGSSYYSIGARVLE
jgi:hypothetical protein